MEAINFGRSVSNMSIYYLRVTIILNSCSCTKLSYCLSPTHTHTHTHTHTRTHTHTQVYEQEGVVQVHSPHFWTLCSGEYMGSLRLEIVSNADSARLVATSKGILKGAGLTDIVIETTAID